MIMQRQNNDIPVRISQVRLLPSRAGPLTARIILEDGPELWLHSQYDPRREAVRSVSSLQPLNREIIVVFGLGLGYYPEELIESHFDRISGIIIFEPCRDIIEADRVLARKLECLLQHEKVKAAFSRQEIVSAYRQLSGNLEVVPVKFLVHPVYRKLFPEKLKEVEETVYHQVMEKGCNIITSASQGLISHRNLMENLGLFATRPGVSRLFGKFRDLPALVVAAGPSLDRNAEHIESFRNKGIIICVDTALRPLLLRDVKPDLVVSADDNPGNFDHFKYLDGIEDTFLVAAPIIDSRILKTMSDSLFIADLDFPLLRWLEGQNSSRGKLEAWGTVSSMAFSLALKLGCRPVIFAGQDFSFPGYRLHCRGHYRDRIQSARVNRFRTLEMCNRETIMTHSIKMEKDINGRPVPTTRKLLLYRDWLCRAISESGVEVINASEGGVLKGKIEQTTLKNVIKKLPDSGCNVKEIITRAYREFYCCGRETGRLQNKLLQAKHQLEEQITKIKNFLADYLSSEDLSRQKENKIPQILDRILNAPVVVSLLYSALIPYLLMFRKIEREKKVRDRKDTVFRYLSFFRGILSTLEEEVANLDRGLASLESILP